MMTIDQNPKKLITWILILTFIVCCPMLFNGFVNYDDPIILLDNPVAQDFSLKNTLDILHKHLGGRYSRFAPLTFVLYSFIHHCAGFKASAYHLVSLLLHLAATFVVFALARNLTKNVKTSALCALLFGIHPVHAETIAWTATMSYPLSSLFFFLSLLGFIKSLDRQSAINRPLCLSFGAFVLSGLAFAPVAFTLPFALTGLCFIYKTPDTARKIISLIPFYVVSVVLLGLSFLAAKHGDLITNPYFSDYNIGERFLFSGTALRLYITQIILPYQFGPVYPIGYYMNSSHLLWTLLGLCFFAILLFALRKSSLSKHVLFGLTFFIFTIVPFLHFYSTSDSITQDRYVYLASFGIIFSISSLIIDWVERHADIFEKRRSLILITGTLLVLYCATIQITQTLIWKNSGTMWSAVIQQFPRAYPAYVSRARHYLEQFQFDKADKDLTEALNLKPDNIDALFLKGLVLEAGGHPQSAQRFYEATLAVDPEHPEARARLNQLTE